MSKNYKIVNAQIVNENRCFEGSVTLVDGMIFSINEGTSTAAALPDMEVIDAKGLLLLPGVIDCHVHFREPGLTHKADLASESAAAVAGGITSFMEMPNTQPQAVTIELLEQKYELASQHSVANYSFFLGATNTNLSEIEKLDPTKVCGVKVFFGASTGNMLVDNVETLEQLFEKSPVLIAAHCENESLIRQNFEEMKTRFGNDIPVQMHPKIRSAEACLSSAKLAIELAKKHNARLHITHLSTAAELDLLETNVLISQKRITAETCTHYLWFCDADYLQKGMRMKVNPAIKTQNDRDALLAAVIDNSIDIVATDHAPHLLSEKNQVYTQAPSGAPMIQHSLVALLELWKAQKITIEQVVKKMCHAPSMCYNIEKRGFIRKGYHADLVLVNPNADWMVSPENVLHKCGWSLFDGARFHTQVEKTFVNGNLVYNNGTVNINFKGKRLHFNN